MSQAELCCPVCAAELTIEQLFAHAETRQAFARLATRGIPLGVKLLAYVGLFAPAKNRMAIARKVKLIEQLLPDLERGAIERKGRDWPAPRNAWSDAIDQMLSARDEGKLTLPLTSHGYLYEILCGMAGKVESAAETEHEQERRKRTATPSQDLPSLQSAVADALALTPAPPPSQESSPYVKRLREEIAARKARLDQGGSE